MGRPKLLLPLGGRSVLECLLQAAQEGGAGLTLVVVRPDDADLAALARGGGAKVRTLDHETPDMRATVLAGLDWLEENLTPAERPGFFLVPADHPALAPEVFRSLLAAGGTPERSIRLPVHQGRRGHPTWIGWGHVPGLRAVPEGQGINTYLRTQAAATVEVPWPDDGVLLDLDTPSDYERLCARWSSPRV